MKRAVFLDRDGVINKAIIRNGVPFAPQNLAEIEILPGVTEALTKLHNANFLLIVISNQPDVARKKFKKNVVIEINNHLSSHLPLDYFKICYHDDKDKCFCRKPLPGAFFEAAELYDIDLKNSFMVGDRWRDIVAGKRAGCKTFFINNYYLEKQPTSPDFIVSSLLEVKDIILGKD